jgi:hypothetical protein
LDRRLDAFGYQPPVGDRSTWLHDRMLETLRHQGEPLDQQKPLEGVGSTGYCCDGPAAVAGQTGGGGGRVASRWRNSRSTSFGLLFWGFHPILSTVINMLRRPSRRASLQFQM